MICSDCQRSIDQAVRYKDNGVIPYVSAWDINEDSGELVMRFVCGFCVADPRYRNVMEERLMRSVIGADLVAKVSVESETEVS